jgi:polyisoprenoid-binding protein YceI
MKTLVAAAACAAAALATAPAHAATYSIDPTHTFVTWEVTHFGTSTSRGRFDKKEGSVTFDRAARTGKVDITIDTASINTGVAPFNSHLKSKDFLNTAAHPKARFVGERLVFNGDKVSEVVGNFTMLGKTMPVTLKATNFNCYDNPIFKREVCGGDFDTTIARSQWGINYGIDVGIPDNVRLLIQVEAIKQ